MAKVGDYVRTKESGFQYPQIARIVKIEKDEGYKHQYYITLDHNLLPDEEYIIYAEDIDKSSPKVIELIQVGDYVNGCLVLDIAQAPKKALYLLEKDNHCALIPRTNEYIETVVTKEQFSSMEYRI